jgi:hypothetical protein
MAWTATAHQSTGTLITATLWDNVQDNLAYLKGQAGTIDIENQIQIPSVLFDGGYYIPKNIREVTLNWEDDDVSANYQVTKRESGVGASVHDGGTGQIVIEITGNSDGDAGMENEAAQNSALSTAFAAARHPYGRFEFAIDDTPTNLAAFGAAFIGFRQTLGDDVPDATLENFAGFWYYRSAIGIYPAVGDGAAQTSGTVLSFAASTRYIVEIYITGSSVEFWVNGVLLYEATTHLPTGALEWQILFDSGGGGGAVTKHMTVGKAILQENLA